jgi:hypothetical protein
MSRDHLDKPFHGEFGRIILGKLNSTCKDPVLKEGTDHLRPTGSSIQNRRKE